MTGLFILNAMSRLGAAGVVCPDGSGSCDTGLPQVNASQGNLQTAFQIVFALVGVGAVFMLAYSGLLFISAQGDPQGIAKARRTIVYALIGLAVAISAEVIVSFVLDKL